MCPAGIKLLRNAFLRAFSISVATTATDLLPADPRRVALVISAPETDAVRISAIGVATTTNGIHLAADNSPLLLNLDSFGNGVVQAFSAISLGAGAVQISGYEVILNDV